MFAWKQFTDIAVCLQEVGEEKPSLLEAASRCAVSRAYYGAFRHALNYAKDVLGYNPTADVAEHKELPDWYRDCGGSNGKEIARTLAQLRIWRNDCDYNEPIHHQAIALTAMTEQSIQRSKKIIELCPDKK